MLPATTQIESSRGRFARTLRESVPLGILACALFALSPIIEPLNALALPLWVWLSRTPWREFGCARPRSWASTLAGGLALGVILKLVMKAVVMPLLGAPAVNPSSAHWIGNPVVLPGTILVSIVGAGWGEESVFRGFLFERGLTLIGRSAGVKALLVLVSSAVFGGLHYFAQGLWGAEQATIFALLFGTVFAVTGRLWPLVVAHAAFDITTVLIVYFNAESAIAHLVFR